MIQQLTILMYHYVRDAEATPYPGIKARSVGGFRGQIEYVLRHYEPIGAAELVRAVRDASFRLPRNAVLLTFDDGYRDHFENVLPILREHKLSGVFAPVARSVIEGRVLYVNKIHFILSATSDNVSRAVDELFSLVDRHRDAHGLRTNTEYWDELAHPNRFDPAEVIFIKRMLQRDLPEQLRAEITDELFRKYVTDDERVFAAELYMNRDELRAMIAAGMTVANHGYDHYWLASLPPHHQAEQIRRSMAFMTDLGVDGCDWFMTYPYGSCNDSLLEILRTSGCCAGFTTRFAVATGEDCPLRLPRLDTNDLPTRADAEPVEYTRQVTS